MPGRPDKPPCRVSVMGDRLLVERAFRSALLRLGFDALCDPGQCVTELQRRCPTGSEEIIAAIDLVSRAAHVLHGDRSESRDFDDKTLVTALLRGGVTDDDAHWAAALWAPALVELRHLDLELLHRPLRPQRTTFVGRSVEVGRLVALLYDARLVSLVGPGGVGKTRLALEAAAFVDARFPDGRFLIELASVEREGDVVEAIASVLDVRHRERIGTTDAIAERLDAQRSLLILDNCEHVLPSIRVFVTAIQLRCPSVAVLVTSREPLRIDGEICWQTKPLSVPPAALDLHLEANGEWGVSPRFEALDLLVARTRALNRDFSLTTETVEPAAEICRRLDGIPLAIELAASQVATLGPAELLAHLDERFHLLMGASNDARRTLRGAVEWSYQLLEPHQQLLFRRLSVFTGGFGLEACREVCSGDGLDDVDVVAVMADLVRKSLVVGELQSPNMRYRLLDTLRHYAQAELSETAEATPLRRRHASWVRDFVCRVAPAIKGPTERSVGDSLQAEIENVRGALHWAIDNGEADIAFDIVAALEDYVVLRLDFEVAALAAAVVAVDEPTWRRHPRRHHALGLVAYASWARGDHEEAERLGRQALTDGSSSGASPSWAAHQAIGNAAWFSGRMEQARIAFTEWAEHARTSGDDFHRSWAGAHLAVAETFSTGSSEGAEAAREALFLARRCGSPFLIALALYASSECIIDREPEHALDLVTEGVTVGRESGNRFAFGLCLSTLASLIGRIGPPTEALALYRLALGHWRQTGNWSNQLILLRNLAEFAARIGSFDLTARLLGALETSGDMLSADIGPEGARLDAGVQLARRSLGLQRYEAEARTGSGLGSALLIRQTEAALAGLESEARTTSAETRPPDPAPSSRGGLSPRELQIVELVSRGLTNRAIASSLFISERTVDTHMTRIRRKLGTTTRTELVLWKLASRGDTQNF